MADPDCREDPPAAAGAPCGALLGAVHLGALFLLTSSLPTTRLTSCKRAVSLIFGIVPGNTARTVLEHSITSLVSVCCHPSSRPVPKQPPSATCPYGSRVR